MIKRFGLLLLFLGFWLLIVITSSYSISCPLGKQDLNGNCFTCDNGYLSMKDDKSVICTQCLPGYKLNNQQCIPETMVVPHNNINSIIDTLAINISGWFGTDDTSLGFMIIFIVFIISIYVVLDYLKII